MSASRPPNLLLLLTDQQRADTIVPGGPCLTPRLQALAAEGTRFERAYAPNPICSPTRASLFTGLLPHAHGMVDVTHAVPPTRADLTPGVPFWPRRLREAGYRTGYFGKWHVERSDRLEAFGFDTYGVELRLTGVPVHDAPLAPRITVRDEGYRDFLLAGVSDEAAAATPEAGLVDRGLAFLDEAARDPERPFFLVVSTEAPHDPYIAPREIMERYDVASIPLPASSHDDLSGRPAVYRRIRRAWEGLDDDQVRLAIACYYAACSLVDDQFGRLLDALEGHGLADDTIVAFTSDHGDYLGAHGLFLKGVAPFEEAYRVPLVLRGPGIPRDHRVGECVSLVDLAPTLVSATLGESWPGHGHDLLPCLRGTRGGDEAFAEFHGQRFGYTQRILWHGRWKYVFNGFAEDELYDLEGDPHELRNLAAEPDHDGVLRAMAARLWRRVRASGDTTLSEAQYGMFRFAPVGPEAAKDAIPPTAEETA
jgi:arylsulfatase A-like enzyme